MAIVSLGPLGLRDGSDQKTTRDKSIHIYCSVYYTHTDVFVLGVGGGGSDIKVPPPN